MTTGARTAVTTRRSQRWWFGVDGLVTGANAAGYGVLHRFLPDVLGGPSALYLTAAIVLAVVTTGLLGVAWLRQVPGLLPGLLVLVNLAWVAGSFAVAVANPFGLNAFGIAWTVAQGLVVGGFAVLQFGSLRDRGRIG